VVVDDPDRLHEGVEGRRSDEGPAALLEVLRERDRLRSRAHPPERRPGQPSRAGGGIRLETPEVGGERAELVAEIAGAAGVVDGGLDLPAVADDAGVGEEARHVARPEARDLLEVEPREGAAERVALPEDGEPGEAGLEPLEADLLEQAHVVRGRVAPFLVVVAEVLRSGDSPEAAELPVGAGEERAHQEEIVGPAEPAAPSRA